MSNTMNTFIIVFGLVSFVNLFTVGQAKSIKADCSIRINNDLPEPQPLLLIPGGSKDGNGFFLPEDADGIVTVAAGQTMLLACPGGNNGFYNENLGTRTAVATCNSGTTFYGCSIRINNDLPEPQPLLLIPGGSKDGNGFFLPEDADGIVTVAAGQTMLLACPGGNKGFYNENLGTRTAVATCNSGTTFYVNSDSYSFSDFACKSYPVHNATASGNTCYDGTKRYINIKIGFQVESDFYKLIDICFDNILYTTLYANATIVSGIAGYQKGFESPMFVQDDFFPGISVDTLYTRNTQQETISTILGSTQLGKRYISDTSNFYLARGHLSPKTDFVYGSQQRATFHFVNVAPQWQTFNGGNWYALEKSVRTYADKSKLNLDVYTGTYGILTFPDVKAIETELYLYVDSNNNKAIPVPKLFWKALYDPKSQAGVVVVGINNPYISEPQGDYLICNDVCSKISWLRWDQKNITKGYLYCCDVNDFRATVKTLPEFTVRGLLTGTLNPDNNSALQLCHCLSFIVLLTGILKFL